MLCLVWKNISHDIVSCNTHRTGDLYQLWATRPNGKNLKVFESTNEKEVQVIKDAIDYATEMGERVLRL